MSSRISSNMSHYDLQGALRSQESRLNRLNNQIGSQQKIQNLRDDPLAAGHSVRYMSYLTRLERFESNAKAVNDQFKVSDGYMNQSVQIMQRVRELTVAGATGTFTGDDLKNMAAEVNELLEEMMLDANAVGPDGGRIFAGNRTNVEPFVALKGNVMGADEPMITAVEYHGSIGENKIEIDENAYVSVDRSGNKVFWSEPQQLFSMRDAAAYQVDADTSIEIDGTKIPLTAGDNVYAVISKVNNSGLAVRAYLDPVTNGLNLETTDAHQMWLQDGEGGSVLSDLGLIKSGVRPPYNIGSSVRQNGGSMFDTLLGIRDAMLAGDNEYLGSRGIAGVDSSIDNMTTRLAENGAGFERVEMTQARLNTQIPNVTAMYAREADIDFTEAISNLKMMEYTQKATMGTIGRLYSNSLLNYLK